MSSEVCKLLFHSAREGLGALPFLRDGHRIRPYNLVSTLIASPFRRGVTAGDGEGENHGPLRQPTAASSPRGGALFAGR